MFLKDSYIFLDVSSNSSKRTNISGKFILRIKSCICVCVCVRGGDFSRLSFESVKRNGFFVMFIYSKLIYYRKLDRLLIFIADDKDQNLNLGDNGNLALGY